MGNDLWGDETSFQLHYNKVEEGSCFYCNTRLKLYRQQKQLSQMPTYEFDAYLLALSRYNPDTTTISWIPYDMFDYATDESNPYLMVFFLSVSGSILSGGGFRVWETVKQVSVLVMAGS